jgi:ATP-dependent Clp protease ATP-binding subunit ClpB
LQDPNRPVGSFIFLGPTGVGKTELSRALAEFLFDDEHAMVRIDMSEYMEKHSVSRLIGAPPGYVGYDEGGYLTEQVRRKPYSVVLFDEIEKAHPDVFNVLLQLLDDGRLTDGQGRTVDFKNSIVIMTSNIGGSIIHDTLSAKPELTSQDPEYEQMEARVNEVLRASFRPEFLNRIDDIIIFHSLRRDQLRKIVDIQVDLVRAHLKDKRIELKLTDGALDYIAKEGYDPVFGARPLKRVIMREVVDRLASGVIGGSVKPGDQVVIGYQKNEDSLTLEVK